MEKPNTKMTTVRCMCWCTIFEFDQNSYKIISFTSITNSCDSEYLVFKSVKYDLPGECSPEKDVSCDTD